MKFQSLVVSLAVAIGLLSAPAFGADAKKSTALERVKKAGKLVVAIDPTYPPMEFEGTGQKVDGFDVDFINEVAQRLGVKVEFKVMNWDGILAGLKSRRYDLIISSMNVTPDRAKEADFVEYFKMSQVFVTKKGQLIKKKEDLVGKVLAVQADTTSHTWAEKEQKAGLKVKEVKAYKLATDAFAAVKAGHAEVTVMDEPVGRYYAKQDPQTFEVTGEAIAAEPVGIAFHKDDKDLTDAVAKAVGEIRTDGTYKKLSTKWFGTELVF